MMPIHGERYTMRQYTCPACGKQECGEIQPECPVDGTWMEAQEEGQ